MSDQNGLMGIQTCIVLRRKKQTMNSLAMVASISETSISCYALALFAEVLASFWLI
jgi:7-cyano-7-deazaguanine synthase in queuosine biosynthesis